MTATGSEQAHAAGTRAPDWARLADRRLARRRRRLLATAGGLVAAGTATAVALAGAHGGHHLAGRAAPVAPRGTARRTGAAPSPEVTVLADDGPGTAPLLSAAAMFPRATVARHGRRYRLLDRSTDRRCADATADGLGEALAARHCRVLYRASYATAGRVAVTVAVAVFDDASGPLTLTSPTTGSVLALPAADGTTYCRGVRCRTASGGLGRYAYFTVAGRLDGRDADPRDDACRHAAADLLAQARQDLLARGRGAADATSDRSR